MKGTHPRRSGGFTLIEMLIVVAIIAVLVAVSIPMVNASLEQAREATDQANERAAKAAALATYLMEGESVPVTYLYRADGTVVDEDVLDKLSSWPTAGDPQYCYGQSRNHQDRYVKVDIIVTGDGLKIETDWHLIK